MKCDAKAKVQLRKALSPTLLLFTFSLASVYSANAGTADECGANADEVHPKRAAQGNANCAARVSQPEGWVQQRMQQRAEQATLHSNTAKPKDSNCSVTMLTAPAPWVSEGACAESR